MEVVLERGCSWCWDEVDAGMLVVLGCLQCWDGDGSGMGMFMVL